MNAMMLTSQWRSHSWRTPAGEEIDVCGMPRRRFECTTCSRAFVADRGHRVWAVNQYQKIYFAEFGESDAALDEEVTNRWLSEPCPRSCLSSDDQDRKKIPNAVP